MTGRTLGHYRIEERLGAGGMGVVYRARDTRLERTVALKLLGESSSGDEAARERLLREARAASALNHPHICTIYEVGEAGGQAYIAMEYVEGRLLSASVPSEGLPVESVLRYGAQIADALAHAHERGVVHRDLKSANVVITPEGRAKVLDFGLAKRLPQDELQQVTLSRAPLGERGGEAEGVAGTLHYMAPEVLRGEPADARSDLWALGVLLYEIAAGVLPFQGRTGFELSSAILREAPAPLPARVPAALRAVIQRCLAKEPGERYQRAGEVRAALETIESGTVVSSGTGIPASRPAVRALLPVLAAGGALLLLLLGAVLMLPRLTRPKTGPPPAPASPARQTLAVLPFHPLSGQAADSELGLGLADAIVTGLGSSQELIVRPTRAVLGYRDKLTDPAEAGKALQADVVLDGTLQKSGDRLRINVQLWRVSDRTSVWSHKYDVAAGDVFGVQDEIGSKVAEALRVELGTAARQRLTPYSKNAETYALLLRGRSLELGLTPERLRAAISIFEGVLEREPENALAHAWLARACSDLGFRYEAQNPLWLEKAESHAQRALELDANLAEAYAAQAQIAWTPKNHFQADSSVALYKKSLALNPNLASERASLGNIYLHLGLFDRAIEEHQRAIEIDPKNITALRDLGEDYVISGQPQRAEQAARAALAVDPNYTMARWDLVESLIAMGKLDAAQSLVRQDYIVGLKYLSDRASSLIVARQGRLAEAEALALRAAKQAKGSGPFHHCAFTVGQISAMLGKKSQALEWLRQAADEGLPAYPLYESDPYLRKLRGDPEYESFLEQLRRDWERRRREM